MSTLSPSDAETFATHWLDAWNRHDLDAILSHYVDDAVFLSPLAALRVGSGRVVGREALRRYWRMGLDAQPQLRFELDAVLAGFSTLTVCYRNHRGQSVAETFELNDSGKVVRAYACYSARRLQGTEADSGLAQDPVPLGEQSGGQQYRSHGIGDHDLADRRPVAAHR